MPRMKLFSNFCMRRDSTACLLLLGLLASGCQTFHGTAPQSMMKCDHDALLKASRRGGPAILSEAYNSLTAVPLNAVQIGDRDLFFKVIVKSLYAEATPTGNVKVTARVANCTNALLKFRARASFLGAGNAPVEPSSAWQTVFIEPSALGVYQVMSLSTSAVDSYYIEFAPAN